MIKKTLLFTFISICLLGHSQTVINSFPAPTTTGGDMAYDGQYLWISGQSDFVIYQLSPIDGTVIRTIPTNINSPYGMTFDGTDLWVANTTKDSIQRIDTLDGTILGSYPSAKGLPSTPCGLAWDGTNLWNNDFGEFNGNFYNYLYDSTFALNSSGIVTQGYAAVGQGPTGLGYGAGYLFSADSETDQIYIIEPTSFTAVDSFPTIGGTHPNGITYDGTYLWLSNNDSDSIYQVDVNTVLSVLENRIMEPELSIFPNPTVGQISIKLSKVYQDIIVRQINVLGQVIKEEAFKSTDRIETFVDGAPGVYQFEVIIDNEQKTTVSVLKE